MTRRGAALLFAPLVLLALGAGLPVLVPLSALVLLVAVVALAADWRRAPGAQRLRVVREHEPLLSIGQPNWVRLTVALDGAATRGLVRDEYPPRMAASAAVLAGALPATFNYTLTPAARGEARFGATVVRALGPWRLAARQTRLGGDQLVRIDPDLSAVRAYEALARRGQLAELGVRTLRRSGEGTEFERVREAVPDDPLRSINWRATARTGRLMAVELMPERAQPVIICMDHGRLMGVGAGALTKLDHAINAALLLVNVALRTGDRAGLLSFSDRVTGTIPPRAGRTQLREIIDGLRPLEAGEIEVDYEAAGTFLSGWQKRRALLAIFTDVVDLDQGAALVRQCLRLRRRHLPLVITVRDPAVDDTARLAPLTGTDVYRRAVAGGLLADREETLRTLRISGIETIDADARTLSPKLVNRYLQLKQRARL
ncbi:MAG: DUF58 domain-containing protein [Candidatus Dormibacteria bacterium]